MVTELVEALGAMLADTPIPTVLRRRFRMVDELLRSGRGRVVRQARSWGDLEAEMRVSRDVDQAVLLVRDAFQDDRGWLLVGDLARRAGLTPCSTRAALWTLMARGEVQCRRAQGRRPGRWRLTSA